MDDAWGYRVAKTASGVPVPGVPDVAFGATNLGYTRTEQAGVWAWETADRASRSMAQANHLCFMVFLSFFEGLRSPFVFLIICIFSP
jgi:hypothetical protein